MYKNYVITKFAFLIAAICKRPNESKTEKKTKNHNII